MDNVSPEPNAVQMRTAAQGSEDAAEQLTAATTSLNATLRTTCVATMLDGGHALNALPQTAGAFVNCRVLPDMKPDEVLAVLTKVIADTEVSLTPAREIVSGPPSPLRPDLLRAVAR